MANVSLVFLSHNKPTRTHPPLDLKLGNGKGQPKKSRRVLVALPRMPTRVSGSSENLIPRSGSSPFTFGDYQPTKEPEDSGKEIGSV